MVLRHIPLRGGLQLEFALFLSMWRLKSPAINSSCDMPENFPIRPVFPTVNLKTPGDLLRWRNHDFHFHSSRGGFYLPLSENNSGWPSNYQFSGNFHFSRFLSLKRHNCSENKKYTKIAQFVSLLSPQSKVWFRKKRRNLAARKNSQFGWFTYFWIFS